MPQPKESMSKQIAGQNAFDELCAKDKCGNPKIYPKNAKLNASEQKQLLEYSQHCAMYKVFLSGEARNATKWHLRVQKEKRAHQQTVKFLRVARKQLKEEKLKSWKADAASKDLARKDEVIEANNKEIEQKVQELAAKEEQIADLKSDLKDIHEEKLALESNQNDTIIPNTEQALMHENLKL